MKGPMFYWIIQHIKGLLHALINWSWVAIPKQNEQTSKLHYSLDLYRMLSKKNLMACIHAQYNRSHMEFYVFLF